MRLGAMSSASIDFDTSIANTTSTPSRFTVSIFVPILGFTKAKTKHKIASDMTTILSAGLNTERSGLNFLSKSDCANFFCALRCQMSSPK